MAKGGLNYGELEVARPEYIVKLYYLDEFFQAAEAWKQYELTEKQSDKARMEWATQVRKVCLLLWSKLAKRRDVFKTTFKIGSGENVTDSDLYQAMKEINVFFEAAGYTKVEQEVGDIKKVMAEET